MGDSVVHLTIRFLSYWHCGTGGGRGAIFDNVVVRDGRGLPFVPGKTLKGLLREATLLYEETHPMQAGITDELFGKATVEGIPETSESGLLDFRNAVLPKDELAWLSGETSKQTAARNALFDGFSSTAIDDEGQSVDHSLRTIETCVPLTLTARVSGPIENNERWIEALEMGCSLVRAVGSHRSRGLGRCRMEIAR